MRVVMLETRFGTEDGYIVRQYSKGKSYERSGEVGDVERYTVSLVNAGAISFVPS